jgi:hypothetical protein
MISSDWLEQFSMLKFAVVAGVYTVLTFADGWRSRAMVFSQKNGVPGTTILTEHLKALTILLLLMLAVSWLYPHLPEWSKEIALSGRSGKGTGTGVDLAFYAATLGLYIWERLRIYIEVDTQSEDPQ